MANACGISAAVAVLLTLSAVLRSDGLDIPFVTLNGTKGWDGRNVRLPLMVLGDGISWNRPSNFTSWIELVGQNAGIDSAWDYGQFGGDPPNATGGSERLIPAAIAAAGVSRADVMITSKIPCSGYDGGVEPMTAVAVAEYIEANLAMLRTDYIDLMLLHHVCRTPAETAAVWSVLEDFKRRGSLKAIGVSNFVKADIEALATTATPGSISANQCHFAVGQFDQATLASCISHGIAVQSYSTLNVPVSLQNPVIGAVAARHHVSAAAVAFKYVSQRGIGIVTASSSTAFDVEDAGIFEWGPLTTADMTELDALQGTAELTCSDCYALPCRTCQGAIRSAGCGSFIDHYDHNGCLACVGHLNASATAKVDAVCDYDFKFKACW